jgi:hypothetical protein
MSQAYTSSPALRGADEEARRHPWRASVATFGGATVVPIY